MATKFPGNNAKIVIIKVNPKITRECYAQSLKVNPYSVETPTPTSGKDEIAPLKEYRDNIEPDNPRTLS